MSMSTRPSHTVVACEGGDRTRIEQRPIPRPSKNELLLRLRVVGFCGTDLFKLDTGTAAVGSVLGHELVGEVVELGEAVSGFRQGDRVAVPHHVACGDCVYCRRGSETMCETFKENLLEPGGFADRILVRGRATRLAARRLPKKLSDDAAVFMEPAACVLRGIERSGLGDEGTALILGVGSMGLLHLLVLRAAWPKVKVLCVDLVEERCRLAERLGASAALPPGEPIRTAIEELSSRTGVDAVFDTVGGARTLAQGLALTRHGGTVVLFAHAPDGARADYDLNELFKHERRVIGTYSGGLTEQARIFQLLENGLFDPSPLVTHRLPLERFQEGVQLVRERKALKVLFTPSESG